MADWRHTLHALISANGDKVSLVSLPPGATTIAEDSSAGYTLVGYECRDDETDEVLDAGSTPTASLDLGAGQVATCTYTNDKMMAGSRRCPPRGARPSPSLPLWSKASTSATNK